MSRLRRSLTLCALLTALLIPAVAAAGPTRLSSNNNWNDSVTLSDSLSADGPLDGQFPATVIDGNGAVLATWRSKYRSSNSVQETWYALRTDGAWQTSARVAPLPTGYDTLAYGGAMLHEAVTLDDGNVLVVALMKAGSSGNTQYFSSLWDKDAQSWSAWTAVSADVNMRELRVKLKATNDGAILVFTTADETERVRWVRYDMAGGTWGSVQVAANLNGVSNTDGLIALAYDATTDTVYLSYPNQSGTLYSGAIFTDDTSSPQRATFDVSGEYSDHDMFHIAAFAGGAMITYVKPGSPGAMYYRVMVGPDIFGAVAIPGFADPVSQPTALFDSLGRLVVTSRDGDDVTYVNYSSARPDQGGTWLSEAIPLHTSGTNTNPANNDVTLALTPDGEVAMVYFIEDNTTSEQSLNLRVLLEDGWSDEIVIDTTTGTSPSVYYAMFAVDDQNRPSVTWTSKPLSNSAPQQVYGGNYFEPYKPAEEPTDGPTDGDDPSAVQQCETVPDIAVSPAEIVVAPGGTAQLTVSMRNLCNDAPWQNSDLLLSLSDGLSVSETPADWLNLGQRTARQALYLNPAETRSWTITVAAAAQLPTAPIFVVEHYFLGAAGQRIDGVFLPPAAPVAAPPATAAPAEAAPAEPAAPPALPVTLPNTGAPLALAGWLLAAAGASTAAGLLLRRRN